MDENENKQADVIEMAVSDEAMHRECFTDIHCHCLPGVDDGPATMLESVTLCRALAADGISTVVATPHQLGRFSEVNEAGHIRQAVSITQRNA